MIEAKISVEDMQKLQEKMEQVASNISEGKVLGIVALAIERQAKMNATGRPGPRVQTGRLRASIAIELDSGKPRTWARVGTNVFYAPFVEFGHSQHVGQFVPPLGLRLVNKTAPAYPFFGPAVEAVKKDLPSMLGEAANEIKVAWEK